MKNSYSFVKQALVTLIVIFGISLSATGFAKDSATKQKRNLNFSIIPMHYGLLKAEPHTWDEAQGLTEYQLAFDASAGEREITLVDKELHETELFVYLSHSGNYFVAQVKSKSGNTYVLGEGLQEDVANAWNFYKNGSHPNTMGHKAIADFAVTHLDRDEIKNKKHLFIGDSWFAEGSFIERFSSQVPVESAVNKAVSGRTSAETLAAFDADLADEEKSDFIWVSLGTNDFWQEPVPVTADEYIANIEKIIQKINASGAKAIVIDASVGIYDYNADASDPSFSFRKELSDDYANALQALDKNENKDAKSSAGGSFILVDLFILLSVLSLLVFAQKRQHKSQ